MELLDALRTTGAVRDFTPVPVDDDTIRRILDTARYAPSGGNRQSWRVIVLRDPEVRRELRDLYLPGWYEYLSQASIGLVPFAPLTDEDAERRAMGAVADVARAAADGPGGFAEHLDEVPALLAVFADLRYVAAVDKDADRYRFAGGASVYPFVWSILLAARSEGLAGVITTMPIRRETDVKTLLGAPPEVSLAAVVALGVPVRQPTRLTRTPVDAFTWVDRFDGRPV